VEDQWQDGIVLQACGREAVGACLLAKEVAFGGATRVLELFYAHHEGVCIHVPYPAVVFL